MKVSCSHEQQKRCAHCLSASAQASAGTHPRPDTSLTVLFRGSSLTLLAGLQSWGPRTPHWPFPAQPAVPILQPSTPHTALSPRGPGSGLDICLETEQHCSNAEADAPVAQGGPLRPYLQAKWHPSLSEAREVSHGRPWEPCGGCRAGQIAPLCILSRQPEQMSPCKHGLHFHTNVWGCDKCMTGRQKYNIKAKSILQKMLSGVRGASESRVSHLSEMVRETDGALWRSIKQA